ncbi:cation:dicarboxylase symporter family transporter [Exiguobacterium sp. TBG-PICH-001]|uniref:cation:dicarboxylate symporter family transporter n=1 Tax=Exiguobacterium abrahamii TaxID=2785532 RepID=UPI0018A79717|nr:cation:dicarboxylase symporter family transporter [Exiguobacterium sp. TBG-PICH-001]MBF8151675.1 cation:dicarboxylase symporter family transporter [Exiguobacterium sp. TBG-PICH-001]
MTTTKRKPIGLAWQILIGLILGITVGGVFYGNPHVAEWLKPIGDIFIRMMKMIVVPIVFTTIVLGVSSVGSPKSLGRLGVKTLGYFTIVTMIAIFTGLFAANLIEPGAGINMSTLDKTDISSYVATEETTQDAGLVDKIVNIVPTNILDAMVRGDMLAIIFFSVLFGLGVGFAGEKGQPVIRFFEGVAAAMFNLVNIVMKFAPIGVFALIGVTVSTFGIESLGSLFKLIATLYVTALLFMMIVFGSIMKWVGIRVSDFTRIFKDELLLTYSTASSETVLPRVMEKLERMGVPKSIVSFVVPTGYSFNLDGSALYQALAALFIAQMYGIDLSIGTQLTLVFVLMLTSKGMAAVPGVSFVVLLATLGTVGIPAEGLAFIAGIDRIMDMMRSVVNVTGNTLASLVIAKWEGVLDEDQLETFMSTEGKKDDVRSA